MTFSNVKAALCFKLCDDLGKKFSWNSFVNGVSKTDTLEDAIRKQDDIVTVKNTKIVPYLEAEGTLITQVCAYYRFGLAPDSGNSNQSMLAIGCIISF